MYHDEMCVRMAYLLHRSFHTTYDEPHTRLHDLHASVPVYIY